MGAGGGIKPVCNGPSVARPHVPHSPTYVSKILRNLGGLGGPLGEIQKLKNEKLKIKKCLHAADCLPGLHVSALGVLCPLGPPGPHFTMDEQVAQGGIDVHGSREDNGVGACTEHGDMGDIGTEGTLGLLCTFLGEEQVEWFLAVLEGDPYPGVIGAFGVHGDLSEGGGVEVDGGLGLVGVSDFDFHGVSLGEWVQRVHGVSPGAHDRGTWGYTVGTCGPG